MAGLLSGFFSPATPDPLGGLLRTNYDAGDQRWEGISQALGAASEAFLDPRQGGGGGWARAIGDIGGAMGKAGTAYGKGKTEYLATALAKEQAQRKIEADDAARAADLKAQEEQAIQDQALTDLIAGLSPEERAWANANPKAWYEEQIKNKYKKSALSGKVEDFSTTPRTVFDPSLNGGKGGYRDFQIGDMGTNKPIDYGPGIEVPGPGEATVRGSQAKAYEKQQDAASTSVLNLAETSTAIDGIRNELLTDPVWKTSWGGKTLKDLPGTEAMALRDRINQINSLAFFSNIGQMQGYGALSNNEGDRVKDAKSRVNQATDLPSLVKALDDLEKVSEEMYARNQRILSSGTYGEMDQIRKENAAGVKFKKSRVPPFPGDGFGFTAEEWNDYSADDKRAFYDAQKLAY